MDKISIAERRCKIYDLLSYAFMNEPNKRLIDVLEEIKALFVDLYEENQNFVMDQEIEDLKQEFYDRFFVSSSSLYVPPFEAAIRDMSINQGKKNKYGKLDSKDTFHVKACYEMVNFKPDKMNMFEPLRNNYFADNLAFEIAFMAFMANNEHISLKNGEEDNANNWASLQQSFLKEHLTTWIHNYARLAEEKGKGLYSELAKITSVWIELDYDYLKE